MPVLTKCPQCATVFRVSPEQLRAAGGWVRCGRCATEFNAVAKLTDAPEDRAVAVNLDSGPAPAQELQNLVSATDRPAGAAKRLSGGGWRSLAWTLGSLLLLAGLAAQYLTHQQQRLAQDPQTRAWIETWCSLSGCTVPPFHDLTALTLRKRDLRVDPLRPKVLLVNAILTNQAVVAQPFPTLELELRNEAGGVVAQRRFTPQQTFGAKVANSGDMAPRVPYHLRLELLMPDAEAVNFGFRFL